LLCLADEFFAWVTNCGPLPAAMFLFSYVADFMQMILSKKQKSISPLL
jgi:hypothetical protein